MTGNARKRAQQPQPPRSQQRRSVFDGAGSDDDAAELAAILGGGPVPLPTRQPVNPPGPNPTVQSGPSAADLAAMEERVRQESEQRRIREAAEAEQRLAAQQQREEAARREAEESAEEQRRTERQRIEQQQREEAERLEAAAEASRAREEAERRAVAEAEAEDDQDDTDDESSDKPTLDELIATAIAAAEEAGSAPTPLEIPPRLHDAAKDLVGKRKKTGQRATMTSIVLEAIGEAQTSGALSELTAAYRAGQTHEVPLFGNVLMGGPAPRGATQRLQFIPSPVHKAMVNAYAIWYEVPLVVLVRLALENKFPVKRRSPRKAAEKTAEAVEPKPEAVGEVVQS
jgi:hypothetical protein